MLNVVATLQQRCGNVSVTSESDVVTTSETDVGTTLILDHVTTLGQRQQRRCDNIVTTLLSQLGKMKISYYWKNNLFCSILFYWSGLRNHKICVGQTRLR